MTHRKRQFQSLRYVETGRKLLDEGLMKRSQCDVSGDDFNV